jgi:hypothetical protein
MIPDILILTRQLSFTRNCKPPETARKAAARKGLQVQISPPAPPPTSGRLEPILPEHVVIVLDGHQRARGALDDLAQRRVDVHRLVDG